MYIPIAFLGLYLACTSYSIISHPSFTHHCPQVVYLRLRVSLAHPEVSVHLELTPGLPPLEEASYKVEMDPAEMVEINPIEIETAVMDPAEMDLPELVGVPDKVDMDQVLIDPL